MNAAEAIAEILKIMAQYGISIEELAETEIISERVSKETPEVKCGMGLVD